MKQKTEIKGIVDKSAEIEAIKRKHSPRHDLSEAALREAADLWGGKPNKHGVLPSQPETVVSTKGCVGEIRFAETSKGYWLTGISAMSSFNGFGYAPSVWHKFAYASRPDARLAGVMELIRFFEAVSKDSSSTNSEANRMAAKEAVQILEAEKTPQLALF